MVCSTLPILLLTFVFAAVAVAEVQEQCTLIQTRNIRQQKHLQTSLQPQCVDNIVKVGVGGCYDGDGYPDSLGWSQGTCGTSEPSRSPCVGNCSSAKDCERECLENPSCGGFMYTHLHCWMFKHIYQPNVKYNNPQTWYTCYAKHSCCPGRCCPPFKSCSAWGDPHFTQSFFAGPRPFEFMKIGLFKMASSKDKSFELQSFQCPYNAHTKGMSIFVAFAMKAGGYTVTILGSNVSIDGAPFPGGKHVSGLNVYTVYAENDKVELDAPDNCVHFSSINFAHSPSPSGYFHNVQVHVADEAVSNEGVCGAEHGRDPIPAKKSLFTDLQLEYLCGMCGISNCVEMTPPDDWVPINSNEEACKESGVTISDAEKKCEALKHDESHFKACIFDYCASGGNKDLVTNAIESKQDQDDQAAKYDEAVPVQCVRPYASCIAWGDPHYTASFFGGKFDFQNVGVFKLASSNDGKFELQAFQCPFGKSWASIFAGFAMNIGGERVTIIEKKITINGRAFMGDSHASGIRVEGSRKPRDTIHVDTIDSCIHLKVSSHFDWKENPGYGHDIFLEMAQSVVTAEGVCGSSSKPNALRREEAFFDASELDHLCQTCQMTDCTYMSPPSDWSPPADANEACKAAGISINDATELCKKKLPDEDHIYLMDCVYDYCASGGDEDFAEIAGESEKEVIDMKVKGRT